MSRVVVVALAVLVTTACVGRPADDATGEEIYLQLCATCHGEGHQGGVGPDLGPGSHAAGQPEEYLRVSIMEGRGRMPSFSTVLSDRQLDRLVAHLLEVQQG